MSSLGKVRTNYSTRGNVTYSVEVWHDELGKYKEIRGRNRLEVEIRAKELAEHWDDLWDREQKSRRAEERTSEARNLLASLEAILTHTLRIDDTLDFERLKDNSEYPIPKPMKPPPPKKPFLANFLSSYRQRHENAIARIERDYQGKLSAWDAGRDEFKKKQAEENKKIDEFRASYFKGEPEAILKYCELVLERSEYPASFPKEEFELDYNPQNGILIVDYRMPSPSDMPTLEQVTYIKSRDEFIEKHIPQSRFNSLYDSVLYQIAIRTIHEIFEADQIQKVASVVFNGYVQTADPATGVQITPCVLSVQANKEEFEGLLLENIEPKASFKRLKGIGSSKLHSLTPVAPVLRIERTDSRFVQPYAVVDKLDEEDNLAAMDWEDFEHLIREIFEKEFAGHGGEVKITRASRDKGVDAVAFDPDPIRGGKIVIQAKRYTNTVGVDAVRDLYGTVI